jgi:hypothetical protein
MSDLKIAVAGQVYQPELSTTQIAILASANAWTFTIPTAGVPIALITTTTPHGLTFTPAAGTLPNFFVTFSGNITAQTGVGTIIGNTFRILSIPSTTTFTIYTTVTAATAATTAAITPVFIPVYTAVVGSIFAATLQAGTPAVLVQGPLQATANCNFTTGPNCVVVYCPDNTALLLDATTGSTPAVAPTLRTLLPASSQGQVWLDGVGSTQFQASGTAGTSRVSVIE